MLTPETSSNRPESAGESASQPTPSHPIEVGVFETVAQAQNAIVELLRSGVEQDAVSVATPKGVHVRFPDVEEIEDAGEPDSGGAAAGSMVGALVGGSSAAAAAVAGSVAGLVLMGPIFVGIITGAVAGGLVGAMTKRGTSNNVADYYEQAVRSGRILVAVEPSCEEQISVIRQAFRENGAEPVEIEGA